MVLATNSGQRQGLTLADIADIYAGKLRQWEDGKPIRLILRGEQETETKILHSMSPAVDAAVSIAQKTPGMPLAENDLEAIEMLASIPGSLCTTSLGLIKSGKLRLRVLPINGVMPSAGALESGKYPYQRVYFLISPGAPRSEVAQFLAWLNSEPAIRLARSLDYLRSQ